MAQLWTEGSVIIIIISAAAAAAVVVVVVVVVVVEVEAEVVEVVPCCYCGNYNLGRLYFKSDALFNATNERIYSATLLRLYNYQIEGSKAVFCFPLAAVRS